MENASESTQQVSWRAVTKRAVGIFLLAFAPVICIAAVIYFIQTGVRRGVLEVREKDTVNLQRQYIARDIVSVTSDLMFLSQCYPLQSLLRSESLPGSEIRNILGEELLRFSATSRLYDQIRLLDENGMEVVRVNFNAGNPTIVPEARLQNKKNRYYFADAFRLREGEVFVSPLDLNIERGEIELPLKPMIRFGTPVFDQQGRKRGIMLLNYLCADLLDKFSVPSHADIERSMLLNSDGYWLHGPDPEDEWGFMYEDRRERVFGKVHPEAWREIQSNESGQFETATGLFTFDTVYPILEGQKSSTGASEAFAPSAAMLTAREYYWKVVSHVPTDPLYAERDALRRWIALFLAVTAVALGAGSWTVAWYGIVRWITEETLKESEEKYRVLVENANEAILVAQDGMLKFANPKAVEITGYSEDELVPMPFAQLIHADDQEMVAERHLKRLSGEELPHIYSFRIIDKEGNVRWVEINAVLIEWAGKPATLNFLTDITDRKRMEQELLKIQKLESVGILAGGIAHDLNNLLTGVIGNISLARMYEDPLEKDKRLAEAEKAAMQISDLTQQLLTFSRGGAPILQVADMGKLLRDSVPFALRGSNVSGEFSISDDLWPVEMDEGQMNRVVSNLIINANQAMPGGGTIRISAENLTIDAGFGLPLEPGAYIKISFSDEGVGISQDYIQKIFDPFFSTKQTGSGLGLASSYSIIQKHNGHITVESQPGVGSTFNVYLPALPDGVLIEEEKKEERPIMGEGRILVMDDEPHIRDVAFAMLGSIGYNVTTAMDGAEAVETYRQAMESGNPFDAVIIDLTVPGGMGGKETIQKLMEIDPEVKAIVSSGYSSDPILANFRKYGFMGLIPKPYRTRELSVALHKVLAASDE